jgi:thioredoxin 1
MRLYMSSMAKVAAAIALVAAVGLVFAVRQGQNSDTAGSKMAVNGLQGETGTSAQTQSAGRKLPKMIDLGASSCIPCKMMKPILDDLQANYADRFETIFIDVWEDAAKGRAYGIRTIPTQIFYDADGKELFRHEGFYSKEDILGKWKQLGINIEKEMQHETD